jgi:hypothetical protein
MIERVQQHIVSELQTNARTDTIFVLTGIGLNLLILAINSAASGETVVIVTFSLLLIVLNLVVEFGLLRGREMRRKLLNGLLRMYSDQGVDVYYDPSLLGDYATRYNLFMFAVLCTGLVALILPLII